MTRLVIVTPVTAAENSLFLATQTNYNTIVFIHDIVICTRIPVIILRDSNDKT